MNKLLDNLSGNTVLITGATGLIGKSIIKDILDFNRSSSLPINVVAVIRNQKKANYIFGSNVPYLAYVVGDIATVDLSNIRTDYIIHAASQTSSKAFVNNPVETTFIAIDGTRHLLEYAKTQENLKRFIFLSTMEVYGTPQTDEKISENHGTNVDTMNVRSCYPESKRMCENLCTSYMNEYGVPVNVIRLIQTFGPGVDYNDSRVFAEFARCVIEKRDIILKTAGLTKRSYLYTEDAVSAILTVIEKGVIGEAYNAANENTYCTIREMAELVANKVADRIISVKTEEQDISKFGYAPTLHMNLDTTKLQKLGWKPEIGLEEMYRRMIADMEESIDPNIDIRLKAKLLPATVALKNGVQNDKNSNPEIYLLEILNESKYFQKLSSGEKYHAPVKEDDGENDAISSSYEIDFKTLISSSMGRALRETSPQVVQYCPGVVGIGPSKHPGETKWCSSITKDLRRYKLNDLETRSYQYQEEKIVTHDIDDFLKVLRKDKNILMFLPVEFSIDELKPTESSIDIIGEALLYDMEFIYEYRNNHVAGREAYISTIYKDDLLIYKYNKDSLDFIEAIPLRRSKTFNYLAQF